MILYLLCSVSYKFIQYIKPNQSESIFPFTFRFIKGGKYSFFISNGENVSFIIFIKPSYYSPFQNEDEINKSCSNHNETQKHENVHAIHIQNGEYSLSSTIDKEFIYQTSIKLCTNHHNGFKIEGTYVNLNPAYISDARNVLKCLLIFIYIRIIIFSVWIINWIYYFSMKNKLHLILTLTAFFFISSKIIDYFDYKNTYESNKLTLISIIRPYFDKFKDVFITNTFFLINCCYCIEKNQKIKLIYKLLFLWCFYLTFFGLLHRICNIYVYYIFGFLIHLIVNNVIIMMSGVENDDDLFVFMVNELKSFFFMLYKIFIPETNYSDFYVNSYIGLDLYVIVCQCILAYCLRMRSNRKNDYYELIPQDETVIENETVINLPILYQQNKIIVTKSVTQIYPKSFNHRQNIITIEFEEGSQLTLINSYTFQFMPIRYIKIPPSVKEISDFAFFNCKNLQYIEFVEKSHISTFRNILENSSICKINIPSSVVKIEDSWCYSVSNLNDIFISPQNHNFLLLNNEFILGKLNKNSSVFDTIIFSRRDIQKVNIPSYIKRINPNAFRHCKKIRYIKFSKDSKLLLISENAFSESAINKIIIPKTVSIIGAFAFNKCQKLTTVDFENNSNLSKICNGAFSNESSLEKIKIPSNVVEIGKNAFSNCSKLKWIDILDDSNLTIIQENAFDHSSIVSFMVTSKVNLIGNQAFANCENLQIIEFHEDSLFLFDENIFKNSPHVIIMISAKK